MARETSDIAVQRLEAAISRLESVLARPHPALAAVEATNLRLRDAVGQSLRQIDALIDQHNGEVR